MEAQPVGSSGAVKRGRGVVTSMSHAVVSVAWMGRGSQPPREETGVERVGF